MLKYMNDFEDSVIFAHVYHEIFMNFIKVHEKKSWYLFLDLNTDIMFCKLLMLSD